MESSNVLIPLFSKKKMELKNFVTNDAEVLSLNISFNNYEKLMKKRQTALKNQILINNQEYVSGSIEHNNEKIDIDIRLKGDFIDHFSNEDKLSFRIIVKDGKTVLGMDKFSIQHPATRNWPVDISQSSKRSRQFSR